MLTKRKIFYYVILTVLPVSTALILLLNNHFSLQLWQKVTIMVLSVLLSVFSLVNNTKKKTSSYRLLLFFNILLVIILVVYLILYSNNMLEVFSSVASFKDFILSTGKFGMFIYVLIQFLQVIFLPIPSMIITLAGVAIYGPALGALLCSIGVLTASCTSFLIGKVFGFKVVSWLAGEKNATKYAKILNEKGKFFLIVAFLLPLFPDDMLCLIAGITTMKFKTFFIIASITRPIGVIFMSYFGGGYIIPFAGWGLFVWPIILVLAIVAVVVMYKYQTAIENYILTKIFRKKLKDNKGTISVK